MSRPQVSVQLYSVRDQLANDIDLTLERLATMGFSVVEPFGLPGDAGSLRKALDRAGLVAPEDEPLGLPSDSSTLRSALDRAGLKAPTAHASVLEDPRAAVEAALEVGVELLFDPFQPESFFQSRSELRRLADQLSAAAQLAGQYGVSIGYHNHDHEIRNEIDGVPALVALAAESDRSVLFEVDLFWCEQGGVNPHDIVNALDGRVAAMHAKDAKRGLGVAGQVPLGQGDVRLLPSIASAPEARIVVEFDEYSGDLFAAIGQCLEFLKQNGVQP